MMVNAGFTAALDGKKLPVDYVQIVEFVGFAIYVQGGILGSFPKRMVPFWCATPASGIRCPTYRLREKSPW